jgi:hypothetical protein
VNRAAEQHDRKVSLHAYLCQFRQSTTGIAAEETVAHGAYPLTQLAVGQKETTHSAMYRAANIDSQRLKLAVLGNEYLIYFQ